MSILPKPIHGERGKKIFQPWFDAAVAIHPKCYVELERNAACISAITITPVEINDE